MLHLPRRTKRPPAHLILQSAGTQMRKPHHDQAEIGSYMVTFAFAIFRVMNDSLVCPIDDLPVAQRVLHLGECADVLGGVVLQHDEICRKTGGDSPQLS